MQTVPPQRQVGRGYDMKKCIVLSLFLIMFAILTGCGHQFASQVIETEPTATYDWMAGESSVSNRRMGVVRAGVNINDHAVSSGGVYFMHDLINVNDGVQIQSDYSIILYSDYGSNMVNSLCGRADCEHDNPDCNACIYQGSDLSYYQGYLYAVSGEGPFSEKCVLMQMLPDGSQHKQILDLSEFAKEQGMDFAMCDMIIDGYCIISLYAWVENAEGGIEGKFMQTYKYKLDGAMKEPARIENLGALLYQCGDHLVSLSEETDENGSYRAYWSVDLTSETKAYLTKHPGVATWVGKQESYYCKEGMVIRADNATGEETVVIDSGLEGEYFAYFFPECIVLASEGEGKEGDPNLYFYNWAFEHVDTVKLDYPISCGYQFAVMAETSERVILTDRMINGKPLYYIEKSELGTGNCVVHEYHYS